MSEKYAGSEILLMAVEIEKKGYAFYDGVLKAEKDPKVKEVFQYLADEEIKHEKLFRSMLSDWETKTEDNPYDDTEMILYFKSLVDTKIFPDQEEGASMKDLTVSPEAAIHVALSFEKDAILYFHEMYKITHESERKAVENIIDEEREHIKRILQLKADLNIT